MSVAFLDALEDRIETCGSSWSRSGIGEREERVSSSGRFGGEMGGGGGGD
jgi:hypothetical protein